MATRYSTGRLIIAVLAALFCLTAAKTASAQTVLSACGTISSPGNYVLNTNLTTSGDCFVITASNVALDMKGHTITGDGSGNGITDDGLSRDYAIISNGKIRNFDMGINLTHGGLATFNKL
jgi:hypothetical protein